MVTIDCAGDDDMAAELENYLKSLGVDAKADDSFVSVDKCDTGKILSLFLKETSRSNYKIRTLDSENFLLSKEVSVEDLDLLSCEICGYVLSSEHDLANRRRTHGLV